MVEAGQRLARHSAVYSSGRKLSRQRQRPKRGRSAPHVARRERRIVQVAKLGEPAQGFADLLLRIAATPQLPPQLDMRVGAPCQQPESSVEH